MHKRNVKYFWTTKEGVSISLDKMADSHLHNSILLVERHMESGMDRVGANIGLPELLSAMNEEREKRGLPLPLIPYTSLEYRKRVSNDTE